MIRFNNDYNHGAHPEILEALGAINGNSYGGYGEDEWCEKAAELIREKIHCADAAVSFFLPGATQANFTCDGGSVFGGAECDCGGYRTY